MVTVTLNEDNQSIAEQAGRKRFNFHKKNQTEHLYGKDYRNLDEEIENIGAEIAVAQALDIEWKDNESPSQDKELGDLGNGIQVRFTRHKNGRLLLHKRDSDEHLYFLVTGGFPNYTIVGYITGKRGKQKGEWTALQKGRPCYVVDRLDLKDYRG